MRIRRSDIWLADLGEPIGSEPGYVRPVLIIQDNRYNDSRLATVIGISLTSNVNFATNPGNVLMKRSDSGLDRDSVINVTQVSTIDKECLVEPIGSATESIMDEVAYGLALVFGIG